MGFFSLNSSQWELSVVCQQIFSISYRFWDKRGQRGQKCDFGGYIKFSFFIRFWWDFFHWIALNEIFQNCTSQFFLSLTVLRYKGPKRAKMWFLWPHEIFIFHPILMGFFSLDSSRWELLELLQSIFSISYCFRDTRGPKGQKRDFWGHIKFLFFIQFWWDFFHWIPLNESFQNCYNRFFSISYHFGDTRGPKGNVNLLSNTLLCPIYYCVKHIIASSQY